MRPWTDAPITLSAPDVAPGDADLLRGVLESGALSCGPMVAAFEAAWRERFGCRHAVAVSSGTAALHVAAIAAGVGPGDLVLTTPFSFVASANAVLYERATPVFVDIDPDTLMLDAVQCAEAADDITRGHPTATRWLPPSVRDSRPHSVGRLAGILPVHVFGRSAEIDAFVALGSRFGVPVIEDACEAVGTTCRGRAAGTIGDAGVFGFYPNKQMTTGEGGMFVTNRDDWATVARSLRNQGRSAELNWLDYDRLGYNYRLDELSSALGLSQLARLDHLLTRRAAVAAMYAERLGGNPSLRLPAHDAAASWFVYVVRLVPGVDRDRVMRLLAAAGVPTRAYFPPIHLQPYYRSRFGYQDGQFPAAEAAGRQSLALPFHNHLTADQIDFVCAALHEALGHPA